MEIDNLELTDIIEKASQGARLSERSRKILD
jgi:hypothetical protein